MIHLAEAATYNIIMTLRKIRLMLNQERRGTSKYTNGILYIQAVTASLPYNAAETR